MRYLLTADRVLEGPELKEIKNGAVVTEDEKIVCVGQKDDVKKQYPDAEEIDLPGKTLMPGLFECHNHLAMDARVAGQMCIRDRYNMAEKDDKLAEAICRGIKAVNPDLILLGPGSGKMVKAAKALGLKTAGEVFADRAYMEEGTLVPRSQEGAMITDEEEAVARVLEMVQKGTVTAITGKKIEEQADSICVHGDGQKALLFVQKIRSELEKAGVVIVPMKEVIVGES